MKAFVRQTRNPSVFSVDVPLSGGVLKIRTDPDMLVNPIWLPEAKLDETLKAGCLETDIDVETVANLRNAAELILSSTGQVLNIRQAAVDHFAKKLFPAQRTE
ncbi:hypothetical protein KGP36_07085 [Patescibacteria group bacterium]|nr:hypothetical protein [Patescibacteria group bacterium]